MREMERNRIKKLVSIHFVFFHFNIFTFSPMVLVTRMVAILVVLGRIEILLIEHRLLGWDTFRAKHEE